MKLPDPFTNQPDPVRAWRVLDLVQAHRASLDMESWTDGSGMTSWSRVSLADLTAECGTTACYATWVVTEAGYRADSTGRVFDSHGYRIEGDVSWTAAGLLGLDSDRADHLFHDTTESQLESHIRDLFGPRPEVQS